MKTSDCRHCKATIAWVRTEAGKSMPIDPEPNAHGNVFCQYEGGVIIGRVYVASESKPRPEGVPYMPHWATCPVLNKHKGDSKAKPTKPVQPQPEQLNLI